MKTNGTTRSPLLCGLFKKKTTKTTFAKAFISIDNQHILHPRNLGKVIFMVVVVSNTRLSGVLQLDPPSWMCSELPCSIFLKGPLTVSGGSL